jgi:hypothetical protein
VVVVAGAVEEAAAVVVAVVVAAAVAVVVVVVVLVVVVVVVVVVHDIRSKMSKGILNESGVTDWADDKVHCKQARVSYRKRNCLLSS